MDSTGQNAASVPQTQHTPLPLVSEPKRHAACDECRVRKLKCSGHRPACDRCARENLLPCVYSLQKQMGRPRKKRRRSDDVVVVDAEEAPVAANGVVDNGYGGEADRGIITVTPMAGDLGQEIVGLVPDGAVAADGGMGEVMGLGGFEGFDFGGMGSGGRGIEGRMGQGAYGDAHFTAARAGDVFELDPNFSLDSLLAGDFMNVMGGSGSSSGGFEGLQHDTSISSHSSPGHGHSLHSTAPTDPHDSSIQSPPQPFGGGGGGLPCACLSNIYLSLSSLHALTNHDFPYSLPPLRSALATARAVLHCPTCPHSMATATQNIHMLISLLMTAIDAVGRLLRAIDAEAARVAAAGASKPFLVADASAPHHMHTGTPDCPVRFGMDLSGAEWRELARKVVKRQVVGSAGGGGGGADEAEPWKPDGAAEGTTIHGLLAAFVQRQNSWHDDPAMIEVRRKVMAEASIRDMEELGQMRLCVQNVEHVVARMKMLDI